MQKTISIQVAVNDKVAVIEQKVYTKYLFIASILLVIVASILGIQLQIGLILILIIIYSIVQDNKEIKRLVKQYGL